MSSTTARAASRSRTLRTQSRAPARAPTTAAHASTRVIHRPPGQRRLPAHPGRRCPRRSNERADVHLDRHATPRYDPLVAADNRFINSLEFLIREEVDDEAAAMPPAHELHACAQCLTERI